MNELEFETRRELFDHFEESLLRRHEVNHKRMLGSHNAVADPTTQAFGRYLCAARRNLHLSQADLALLTAIPPATIMALESGLFTRNEIKLAWIEELATVLEENPAILRLLLDAPSSDESLRLPPASPPSLLTRIHKWLAACRRERFRMWISRINADFSLRFLNKPAKIRVYPRPIQPFVSLSDRLLGGHLSSPILFFVSPLIKRMAIVISFTFVISLPIYLRSQLLKPNAFENTPTPIAASAVLMYPLFVNPTTGCVGQINDWNYPDRYAICP